MKNKNKMLLTQISSPTAERQREKRRFLIVSFRLSMMLFGGIGNIDIVTTSLVFSFMSYSP